MLSKALVQQLEQIRQIWAMDQLEKAYAHYEALLQDYPEHPVILRAFKKLSRLIQIVWQPGKMWQRSLVNCGTGRLRGWQQHKQRTSAVNRGCRLLMRKNCLIILIGRSL
jgi:hypothetical protein